MEICDWVKSGTARKVEDLLKAVRMMAFADELPLHQDRIHVSNGTWYLDDHFSEEKEYCRNRLEVAYNSAAGIANVWLNFLSDDPAGVPGILPASYYEGPEDAPDDRKGRRRQIPDRTGDAVDPRDQYEHHQHSES